MKTLTLVIGLPGSGKTTYVKSQKYQNTVILSSDEIRRELFKNGGSQSDNDRVFKVLYARARKALLNGKSVVIDATNIDKYHRALTLTKFKRFKIKRVAVVIDTPAEKCIANAKCIGRTAGVDIVRWFSDRFEMPEYSEGFDEIKIVNYLTIRPSNVVPKGYNFDIGM